MFIAQEIMDINELKYTVQGGNYDLVNEDTSLNEIVEENYSLDYNSIFTYNVKATQELLARVKQLENRIQALESAL